MFSERIRRIGLRCDCSAGLRRRSLKLTRNITSSLGGYLPNTVTEMWEPSRDFAFLKLPVSGARCIVAISGTMPHVMVISSEGYFYSYNIDLENGGECSLMKQYRYVSLFFLKVRSNICCSQPSRLWR